MRHRRKLNHLSRKSAHRKAMMANMASSLIIHKRINTTVAKAKALRIYVEPLITKSKLSITTKTSKEEATHLRRVVFSYLQNKEAVTELFREVSAKVVDRDGGYTRIIKTGARLGDNAEMCMMELVDYNENLLTDKSSADSKARKRRRGGKKKVEGTAAPEAAVADEQVAEVVDDVAEETAATEEASDVEVKAEEKTEEVVAEAEPKAEAVEEKVEEVVAEEPVAEAKPEAEETKTEDAKDESDEETKKEQ